MRIHGNLTKAKRANRTRDGPVFLYPKSVSNSQKVSNKKN